MARAASKISPPRQQRSRETLDRLISASEELLGEKSFDEISVAALCLRAGLTVGAFYARFPDKDAMLHFLAKQLLEATPIAIEDEWRADAKAPLAELIRSAVGSAVQVYRQRRALMRALILRSRSDKKLRAQLNAANQRNLEWFMQLLLARRDEIGHRNPRRAAEFGLLMVVSTIREVVVFNESWHGAERFDDDELARELSAVFIAYMQIKNH